jgi:hypothetical protein
MPVSFHSMTSRSACVSLSEQQKSLLLHDVLLKLDAPQSKESVTVYDYQHLKVVVEPHEESIKVMTKDEFRRLYPTLTRCCVQKVA